MFVAEFRSYFEHIRSLRFEDRPDYDYLKRLFRELFFRKGFSYDNMFDWELLSNGGHSSATADTEQVDEAADAAVIAAPAAEETKSQSNRKSKET